MPNTTAAAVQTLLGEWYDSNYAVTTFITTASVVVTKHCIDDDLTTAELEEIERYLAAHFYCITHRRSIAEKAGDVGENKQHVEDLGFDATEFGQMAKVLDWTGALASLDRAMKKGLRRSVSISWAGKENDETNEYELLGL
jgi:hypothetical protein